METLIAKMLHLCYTNHSSMMHLTTDRLILHELIWDDLPDIHHLNSHQEVAKFNTLGIPKNQTITREVIRATVEDREKQPRTQYGWTIRTQRDDLFIGETGMSLFAQRYRQASIFYNLLPSHWKQGYATEVAQALIIFGFDTLQLHRIEAGAATENAASLHVLEKIGMTREGISRKILPTPAGWRDNYRYAILEDDPRAY